MGGCFFLVLLFLSRGIRPFLASGRAPLVDDADFYILDVDTGLMVPQQHLARCVFESTKKQNLETKFEANRENIRLMTGWLWNEDPPPVSLPSYLSKNQDSSGLVEWKLLPF